MAQVCRINRFSHTQVLYTIQISVDYLYCYFKNERVVINETKPSVTNCKTCDASPIQCHIWFNMIGMTSTNLLELCLKCFQV